MKDEEDVDYGYEEALGITFEIIERKPVIVVPQIFPLFISSVIHVFFSFVPNSKEVNRENYLVKDNMPL